MKNIKLGVALGGGGGRGLAHIGVLKGLEELGLVPSIIAGTSSGALMGALYAMYGDADKVREVVREALKSSEIEQLRLSFFRELDQPSKKSNLMARAVSTVRKIYSLTKQAGAHGLVDGKVLEDFLEILFEGKQVEGLKIAFGAVATDLVSTDEVVIRNGDLLKAVQASITRPGVFPAVRIRDMQLVDGGVTGIIPINAVRKMGADLVLAVDVRARNQRYFDATSGLDAVNRSENIMYKHLGDHILKDADLVVAPSVKRIHWADFRHLDFCYRKGEEAIIGIKPLLYKAVARKKWAKRFEKAAFWKKLF